MESTHNLLSNISESIKKAQKGAVFFEEIYTNPLSPAGKNEFLFFIKPEITIESSKIKLDLILNLVLGKVEAFGFAIRNIKILSAEYLEKYNIIAQHYGVINKIASNAVENMSESAKEKFKALYGKPADEVKVLGGIEFLKLYPDFNATSLDFLWQNKNCDKLAGGTYSMEIKVDSEMVYLVNGFHPRQLEQFTAEGRSIVVMTLSGNASWASARTEFIGATSPQNAAEGSIRRELLNHKDELGLDEISQGLNGVHLSAGPVEGLVELIRYNSDFSDTSRIRQINDFNFGKTLLNKFNSDQIAAITSNKNVLVDGKTISVFDLTEEKDSDEAIALLEKYI